MGWWNKTHRQWCRLDIQHIDKDGAPFYRAYYADVTNVTADNAERVTFSFAQKTTANCLWLLPKCRSCRTLLEDKSFDKTTLEPPVAAGPYKITSVTAGRQIEFTRNADWWAKIYPSIKAAIILTKSLIIITEIKRRFGSLLCGRIRSATRKRRQTLANSLYRPTRIGRTHYQNRNRQ